MAKYQMYALFECLVFVRENLFHTMHDFFNMRSTVKNTKTNINNGLFSFLKGHIAMGSNVCMQLKGIKLCRTFM